MENTEQKVKKARRYNEAQIREAVHKAKADKDKRRLKNNSGKDQVDCKWIVLSLWIVSSIFYCSIQEVDG